MIPPDDRGFLLGDGLFETILVEDGKPVWWLQHVERLTAGCHVLGLTPPSPKALEAAAAEAIGGRTERLALRLTWTAGSGPRGLIRPEPLQPLLYAAVAPAPKPATPAVLVLSDVRRNEGSPASRLKSLAYLDNVMARTRAYARGADDAVMLNNRGEVTCTSSANIFWIEKGALVTPAFSCGALAGVAGVHVTAAARQMGIETRSAAAPLSALEKAEAVFLTNSIIKVRAVVRLEDRTYAEHPLVRALAAAV